MTNGENINMSLKFATSETASIALHVIAADHLDTWARDQDVSVQSWIAANGFKATIGSNLLVPGAGQGPAMALVGYGTAAQRQRGRFAFAAARASLPKGIYHLASGIAETDLDNELLGWLLAGYRFDRYASAPKPEAQLVCPAGCDAKRLEAIASGEALTRDLINTPASDMGPEQLELAARNLAKAGGATIDVTVGDDLIAQNFPMIHAVGRASAQAPRLLDMTWGTAGPKLTLVGKGVCFDTGGLNLKPGSSMGLMKKDMGGAAAVLGLAHMIMSLNVKVQLRVLIPAVENSVSSNSFRPQDILMSRKGLSVEINNTDAEGRLVLADALALADEDTPDLLISMATLTGAARVAVGPDLAPFYAQIDRTAAQLLNSGQTAADPLWRMPFWDPYEKMIEPGIADLDNAPAGGFAGSITAALFLRRFVENTENYVHFDMYGWQPVAAPARPKGGAGQGTRAILDALPGLLSL